MKTLTLRNGVWRYDESSMLGSPGGFAAVYAGFSAKGEPAAVKVFHASKTGQAERELQFAVSRLGKSSMHVIAVLDCGIDAASGQPAVAMARGDYSLAEYAKEHGPLGELPACEIACAVVDGLLDVAEWIHRDLKPANVIWCDGHWQLVDFGIARIAEASTATGTMKGFVSAAYAAPEQWNSERATHATDVYALGCVIHELMTGETLFKGPTQADFAHQHRHEVAPIFAGSPLLQSLLHGMVAKPQAARPTLQDLRERLEGLIRLVPDTVREPSSLSKVSAVVSAKQAEEEAAAAVAQRANHDRNEMREHALRQLRDIQSRLFKRIIEEAPAAQIRNTGPRESPVMEANLGVGTLSMSVGHHRKLPTNAFQLSGWDVVCADHIRVANPGYRRGASLWYVKNGAGPWRWLEVSYFSWDGRGDNGNEPCNLPPGREADLAAANVLSHWNFAHRPRDVGVDGGSSFIERWMEYLAEAAQGRLRRPSSLPEAD